MDHRLDSSLQPHGVLQYVWKQGGVSTTVKNENCSEQLLAGETPEFVFASI